VQILLGAARLAHEPLAQRGGQVVEGVRVHAPE
jgi:hypothetical protein